MSENHVDRLLQRKQAELSANQRHIDSVADLIAKNRLLHERARAIIDLGGNDKLSPPIALKRSDESGEKGAVIGFAAMHTTMHDGTNMRTLTLAMYSINSDQLASIRDRFSELELSLITTEYQADQAMSYIMGRVPDTRVFAPYLGVSLEGEHLDEINGAIRRVASKAFMFSRAINLRKRKKRLSGYVDNIESNLALFESAVDDPELNPDYADGIDKTLRQIQDLPEYVE